jgi:hypothetical protein
MTDDEFDAAIVGAAFALGAEAGWRKVSAAAACQRAGLDMTVARQRFPYRGKILVRFGELADVHALTGALTEGAVRDRLFDILLRRFDFLQMHRAGVVALMKTLPLEPVLAMCLGKASLNSMGWMLEGAGVTATGGRGEVRKKGLLAVWLWGMRAWMSDETADLSATMAAVDTALNRADQIASRFEKTPAGPAEGPTPEVEPEPELPFAAEDDLPPAVP